MAPLVSLDAWLSAVREDDRAHADAERELSALARALTAAEVSVDRLDLRGTSRVRRVRLDAAAGAPDAPRTEPQRRLLGAGHEAALHSADEVVFAVPVQGGGALEASRSVAPRRGVIGTLVPPLALALAAGLAAALAGARLVGRPVARLVDLARRLGAGDLEARAVGLARDELGVLGEELDGMAARLLAARRRAEVEARTPPTPAEEIAHALGSPLSVVGGRARMIASRPPGPEAQRNAKIIGEQVERMTSIIRRVLEQRAGEPRDGAPSLAAPSAPGETPRGEEPGPC